MQAARHGDGVSRVQSDLVFCSPTSARCRNTMPHLQQWYAVLLKHLHQHVGIIKLLHTLQQQDTATLARPAGRHIRASVMGRCKHSCWQRTLSMATYSFDCDSVSANALQALSRILRAS